MNTFVGILALFVFLLFGMPVAFALLAAGALGLWLTGGNDVVLGILATVPFRSVATFILTTVPLFILMAAFVTRSRMAEALFSAAFKWTGHLPGGLAVATTAAGAGFGALSGSSTAAASAMAAICVPEMHRFGYNRGVACGVVTIAGTLSVMIPPSVPMVIYGIQTGTSIGKLLIAGIIPGIILTLVLSLGIVLRALAHPHLMPSVAAFKWRDRWAELSRIGPLLILVVIVVGGIYAGVTTPTEAAALGAAGAWLLGLATRQIDFQGTVEALLDTAKSTAMIFAIVIGATTFSYFLTFSGTAQDLVNWVVAQPLPRWGTLSVIIVLYLILGCFLDTIGILLLTLPLVFPLIEALQYDPVWFGVILVVLLEIGLATPPVGTNAFVVSSVTGIPPEEVFVGSMYMVLLMLVGLAIFLAFPNLVLWLPNLMKPG
ncbi:MAG: TRAP transporter large permease [Burkholderiaceae bacterium]|nr:TRAP transporter large permease [Burkholderiaceae bacterium]